VITGHVSDEGVPVITLEVAGQYWSAIIDTGFNGDLGYLLSAGLAADSR